MSAHQLELRILTGLHQGASVPAANAMSVGSDADCDIVLSDPGMPALAGYIRVVNQTWQFDAEPTDTADAEETAPRTERPLEPGLPLRVGPVWISVAPVADPWPDPNTVEASAAAAQLAAAAKAAALARTNTTRRAKPYKRAAAGAMAAGIVLALVIGTRMFWTNATANATPASPYKMELERASRQAAAVLDALMLASDAQVHQQGDDPVTVTGWVRNDVEYEQLAAALSRIQPRPALKVEIATVQIRAAQNVLKDFLVRSNVQYLGSGRLTIQGIAATAERRTAAVQTLEAKLAGVTVETHGIVLLADVTTRLNRAMNAVLLPIVPVKWTDDALTIDTGRLDNQQLQVLHPLVAQFNKNNFNSVRPIPQPPPALPPEASIPFRITSVVGGAHPWLLLACGTKLMVGGTYDNYRLESIAKDKIVFRGPDTLVTIQR
ncbi:type III secretion system inner membrane ring subunit SctD [Bordetella sp. LUAb4]|uniref:type III secretion system inner membrane ring subunit SctD n=1 Tax=Bordetella sp. LUAb4 TaxID=2843195 RepID=UPI00210416E4|nr:type III secretion system inner membrane ring subunit SctD [Bordetella sp. LUAb4]